MKFLAKLIISTVIIIVIALGIIVFYPNLFLKGAIESVATKATQTSVTISDLDYSVFNGQGSINNLKIDNPDGFNKTPHLFSVDNIEIQIDKETLFDEIMVINLIKIINPNINYEQGQGSDNLQTLQKNIEQTIAEAKKSAGIQESTEEASTSSTEQKFIIEKFILQGANIKAYVKLLGNDVNEIILPDIILTDLGKKSKGASAAELAKQLFDKLITKIHKAFISNKLGDLFNLGNLNANLSNLKNKATEQLNKLTQELEDKVNLDDAKQQLDSIKNKLGADTLPDNELIKKAEEKAEELLNKLRF